MSMLSSSLTWDTMMPIQKRWSDTVWLFFCFKIYSFHVHLSITIVSSLLRPSSIRPPFDNGFDQQRLNMACFFPVRYGV